MAHQLKLFQTMCDFGDPRLVSADDCGYCPHGSVINNRSRVLCAGVTKFFVTPCLFDMKASATTYDCRSCEYGDVSSDSLRVICKRI